MNEETPYYGKYRGTVVSTADPLQLGRLQALVPDVTGLVPSTWALPCAPVAGPQMGMFALPPVGSNVWIEYEQGDPDHPVWTGCFWGSAAELPKAAKSSSPAFSTLSLQTQQQSSITVSDAPGPAGGIALETASGMRITVNQTGITIDNGQGASIVLSGPSVSINGTALVVT